MALKRPTAAPGAAGGADVTGVHEFDPGRTCLGEFMTCSVYVDGSKRELPTLNLFLHDGRLTGALNDRDNHRTAFVSAVSLAEVLDALERGLDDDSLGWRPNKPIGGRKK